MGHGRRSQTWQEFCGTVRRLDHLTFVDERPREVELKLELPSREVERLKRALRQDPRLAEPPRTDLLVSTYFDTDRRDLRDAGVSLRVRRLAAREPPRLQIKSKAERGYELIASAAPAPVKFAKLKLARGTSSLQAFRLIAHACLRQLAANDPSLQHGDAEAVHQMRTAMRRLRAAFSLFSKLVSGTELTRLKGEIKWITGELAPARELDVYLAQALEPAKNRRRDGAMSTLEVDLRRRRAQALTRARTAATSPRYRNLLFDLVAWIETGAWANPSAAAARRGLDRSVQKHAAKELTRRRRKIKKRGRAVRELEPQQRHKLRIAIKKVRYATDFFAALFPGPARQEATQVVRGDAQAVAGCARQPQ